MWFYFYKQWRNNISYFAEKIKKVIHKHHNITSISDCVRAGYTVSLDYGIIKKKNVKNTHEGALLLVKLQSEACNFTKSNTLSWVFFTLFKLYKLCQMAQSITYMMRCTIWHHLYNLKNVKNTHGGVLISVLKLTLLHGCFSHFLNCTNGGKRHKASYIDEYWDSGIWNVVLCAI